MNFKDHKDVLSALDTAQEAETDNRERAREAHMFVNTRTGQWEPTWWSLNENRPRYTFDMTTPIIDQIAGAIEEADFDIKVRPSGGDTSKEDAKLLDGMIRNIENISNARATYALAARAMITSGISGWVIKQKFIDDNSFDQDLVIEPVSNFVDSVWPGPFKMPDGRDMKYAFVLEAVPREEYEERWPEGSAQSLSQNSLSEAYYHKLDQIIVGQVYWTEYRPRTLHLLSDGRVIEEDDQNKMVMDELAMGGVTVINSRVTRKAIVKTRLFDNGGWLTEEQETVFSEIPVIPVIGNFEIFENKLLYHGVVEKMLDPQRVFNYAKSREIEEGALAPRAKYWMTTRQTAGHEAELATMNTNAHPVQLYNNDPEVPGPPQQSGGAQINPGLMSISETMAEIMRGTAGLYAANMGDNPGLQSGVAIEKLQKKGDAGTIKYFQAMELAIARTGRILVDAIPKVYDTRRTIRIMQEDGSFEMTVLNDVVMDQQTGQLVAVNDVSKGKYDVTCKAGPSFQNRQQETVSALTEIAQVDPTIIDLGGDILYNNLSSPGMDLLAERKRQQLFQAGMIPMQQLTQEEQMLQQQQAQQPPQPDPAMLLAQAELEKANADKELNMVKLQIAEREANRKDQEAQIKAFEARVRAAEAEVEERRSQIEMLKAQTEAEAQRLENMIVAQKAGIEIQGASAQVRKTESETTKNMATAAKTVKETAMMGLNNG